MEIKTNIIKKPKNLITVEGKMGVRERIIYNFFLGLIDKQEADIEGYYSTSIKEIKKYSKINNYAQIKDILLNKLPNKKLKINLLDKNDKLRNKVIQLIGEIELFDSNEVKLFFTPTIIAMVKNKNYTKIDLNYLIKLNSKYSLTMYEIIKRYFVSNDSFYTIPNMEINIFREIMGIEDSKYKNIAHLERYVLLKIKKDINEKTDFNFDYTLQKRNSNKYDYLSFKFSKKLTENEQKKEQDILIENTQLKDRVFQLENRLKNMTKERNSYRDSVYNNISLVEKAIDNAEALHQEQNPELYEFE